MTPSALAVLGGLVGVAVLAAAVTAVRHPAARRLAVRSARRRPAETVLVTVGSLLGTAIITGSLIVGDTLHSSIRSGAFTELGPIDETVTAPGLESRPRLRRALSGVENAPAVDGVAFGARASGTAATGLDTQDPAVQPDVLLMELDFARVRDFGGDTESTGLGDAPTLEADQVAISGDLADELGVGVGDPLSVFAYGSRPRFRVASVLPRVGLAGYSIDRDAESFDVFLPPGTLEQLIRDASRRLRASPPVALAFISNRGDVLDGAQRSQRVTELIQERIATVPQASVTKSKQQLLDAAEEIGSRLSEIFLGIGAFALIAGILLLVNVFVMLAQERRSELGIMRAVGMNRTELVRAFYLEGSLYAGAAATLGAVVGIGVGAAIVQVAEGISGGPATFSVDLRFGAEATSIVGGMLIGLLISLLTILATSVRIARLNIIRAIRELPEPPRRDRRVTGIVAGWLGTVAGLAITAGAVATLDGAGLFLGPAILAGGLVALMGRIVPRRPVVTVLGLLVVAWGVLAPTLLPGGFRDAQVGVFVVQGVMITGAAVVVLARNQDAVGRLVRRAVGGTANVTARLGLAYPLARPFRTTMTLAMYALVVFTLVLISLLSRAFGGQVEAFGQAESGSYDLLVQSAPVDPLPASAVRKLQGVEVVAPLRHASLSVEFRAPGQQEFRRWFASGFDRSLLRAEPPALDRWLASLPDDELAVWEEVLGDPSTMIAGSRFLQAGGSPQPVELGDAVEMRDAVTGATEERTIVAMMEGGLAFSGPLMSEESLISVLGPRVSTNRLYVALDEGSDPQRVAATLEEDHLRHGVEVQSFRAIVAERQQENLQFFRLLQGYLMLGLLVGIAGLGVIMVRAVRERRQQIGVLRSLGFQPGTVGRSFMLEAAFIALQGIVVGASLGTATAYQLVENAAVLGGVEVAFEIPWGELALLLGITLVASVAAAGWPALQAGRIRPAVAMRTTE